MVTTQLYFSSVHFLLVALLIACGCSNSTDPDSAGGSTYRGADYMWDASTRQAVYNITTPGKEAKLTLTFARQSDTTSITHSIFSSGIQVDSLEMRFATAKTPFELTQFSAATLFRMPPYSSLAMSYQIARPEFLSLISLPDESVFAGTRSHGLLKYDNMSNSLTPFALANVPSITMLRRDAALPQPRLYAANSSGLIFYTSNPYTRWTQITYPGQRITDMTVALDGKLIVIEDATIRESDYPFSNWTSYSLGQTISSVGHMNVSQTEAVLNFGTNSGKIIEDYVIGRTTQQQFNEVLDLPGASINKLISFENGFFPIAGIIGGYSVWVGAPSMWVPVFQHTAIIHDVAMMENAGVMFFATDQGVFLCDLRDSLSIELDGLKNEQVTALSMNRAGVKTAFTRNGTYRSLMGSGVWDAINDGIASNPQPTALTMLLPEMRIGITWEAGWIVTQIPALPTQLYPITARVLHHLDELYSSDRSTKYEDVLVVRYAWEDASGTPDPNALCWKVYYARGIGPVMIEDLVQGRLLNRLEREKQYGISPIRSAHY